MKKFEFIAQDLLSKIYQNPDKERLLSERTLAEEYKVSRSTIRKALEKLESIGAINTKQNSGNYVNQHIKNNPLIYSSITEKKFDEFTYQLLKLYKCLPNNEQKNVFSLSDRDYIWTFKRLRYINGKVVQIEYTQTPVYLFPKLNQKIIESSLQKFILSKGFSIANYLTSYLAVNISKDDAVLLDCKRGTAAMKILSRGFLTSGEVFSMSEILDIDYQCTYVTPFNNESINFRNSTPSH
ncbi:MAG: DNA-binding GntR family transcriptional regulator [Psychromonas sp.]|jgi:DNA-binding GntR family transcriptional regulator